MNFKNALEKQCFEVAREVLGADVHIQHNKHIQIENALYPEVAGFKGPPRKEIDVLIGKLAVQNPAVTLFISCKDLTKRAEPAHVQEWAAVLRTMNAYSRQTLYLGMIVAPQGFTSGCETWATSHNLGLIPPLKGKALSFSSEAVLAMFRRTVAALVKRVALRVDDLATAPAFFDFVYSLVSDFEGHEPAAREGRYFIAPHGWVSSFGEMYSTVAGAQIADIITALDGTILRLSSGVSCFFSGARIDFGPNIVPHAKRFELVLENRTGC